MSARPILFSTPMVRALLDGRKTQTRRTLKPQPDDLYEGQIPSQLKTWIGDVLWVREAGDLLLHADDVSPYTGEDQLYPHGWRHKCDGQLIDLHQEGYAPIEEYVGDCVARTRPSIHMPRWASRLTLMVTDVRVQRLQDISEGDALAEGPVPSPDAVRKWGYPQQAKYAFADLWDGINGPGAWDANPWVAAYTFTVHKTNVDTFLSDRRAAA